MNLKFVVEENVVVKFLADTSYMIYLLQLNVGMSVMFFLKTFSSNAYLIALSGLISTILAAALVHYFGENIFFMYYKAILKKIVKVYSILSSNYSVRMEKDNR